MNQPNESASESVKSVESGKSTWAKIFGLTGFIIGFVTLIIGISIYFVAIGSAIINGGGTALSILWLCLSATGLGLSILGIKKSKAVGKKPEIALYGLVLGIISVLFSLIIVYFVHLQLQEYHGGGMEEINNTLDNLKQSQDSMH